LDPLRPTEVPSGDFYELIRKVPAQDVIVSFMGLLYSPSNNAATWELSNQGSLLSVRESLSEQIDLRKLFQGGLLHAAIVSRPPVSDAFSSALKIPETFDQLYMAVTAGSYSSGSSPTAAAF